MLGASKLWELVFDPLIRHKAKIHETPLETYSIRIAHTLETYEDAFKLLHIAYAYLGIEGVRAERRMTPHHMLPESTVFVAYEGEQLVGTMTVTLDSPAGLPLDHDYPRELAELRRRGARLVEFGSLAVVRRCQSKGVTLLLNTAAAHWSINTLKATDCVIGVHPRAEALYRALFAFLSMGAPVRHCELKAPVLGMQMNFVELVDHLSRKFPKKLFDGRTIAKHVAKRLPACIEIPVNIPEEELTRWKLPRNVFQRLFARTTNQLQKLDPSTRAYLQMQRTDSTLEFVSHATDASTILH